MKCVYMHVSRLRTSRLVHSDSRPGSGTGQTEERGGGTRRKKGLQRGSIYLMEEKGDGKRLLGRVEGIFQTQDGGGCLRYENGHSRCPGGVGVEPWLVEVLGCRLGKRGVVIEKN